MAKRSARTAMATSAIIAEDQLLASIMRFVRMLNGTEGLQELAAMTMASKMAAEEAAYNEAILAKDYQAAFGHEAAMFGCVSILQKATAEWERYDREEGEPE